MDSQNLWSCGLISPKAIPIFHKNFLDFRLDMIKKQSIINLISYSNKIYASVVLRDSEVSSLGKSTMQPFIHFSFVFTVLLYTQCYIIEELCHQISLSSILLEVFHQNPQVFMLFIFFCTVSSSPSINYSSLTLGLFGMHLATASKLAATNFLYSSFRVCLLDASLLFIVTIYWVLISLLACENQTSWSIICLFLISV